jgi:hypothetical protein
LAAAGTFRPVQALATVAALGLDPNILVQSR